MSCTGRWAVNRAGRMEPIIKPKLWIAYSDCTLCRGLGYIKPALEYSDGTFREWEEQCSMCKRRRKAAEGEQDGAG